MRKGNRNSVPMVVVHPATFRLWVHDSWHLAQALLWRDKKLKAREEEKLLKLISAIYSQIPPACFHEAATQMYCHLAKRLLESRSPAFDIEPTQWFNPGYSDGFYSEPLPTIDLMPNGRSN